MKKSILIICLIFQASVIAKTSDNQSYKLLINPQKQYQTINSFGASDAWWAQFIGKNYPEQKKEQIAEWLFSQKLDKQGNPKGIGLSLWRFNIGTGNPDLPKPDWMPWNWRHSECFMNADGSFDWSRQKGQRWFLEKAIDYGVKYKKAIVYSPVWFFTRNGKAISSKDDKERMNIKSGKIDDQAGFIAEVLEHFHKQNITFDYLSPFNEPEWDWSSGEAEGTPATNDELYMLIRYLNYELKSRQLPTKMIIGDCGSLHYMFGEVKNKQGHSNKIEYFCRPGSPTNIMEMSNVAPVLSSHSYHTVWPVETLIETRQKLAAKFKEVNPNVSYWQTEYCILQPNDDIGGGWGRDLGMDTALYVARIIHHDLTVANASNWTWWLALSQVDFKGSLLYVDDGNTVPRDPADKQYESLKYDGVIRDSKLLWAFGNYSRFIRPGMHRIDAGFENALPLNKQAVDLMVSAYKNPAAKEIVVVLVNYSKKPKSVQLPSKPDRMFLTSDTENLGIQKIENDKIKIPARSIATVIIDNYTGLN